MSRELTIRTTLERLDHKPALWKGLTIDELLLIVGANLVINVTIACIICTITFGMASVGLILGILMSLGGVPLLAGRVENAKKIYGDSLMWIHLKKNIQRRGWMKFDGLMTDKIEWDIRLSTYKNIQYRGKQ